MSEHVPRGTRFAAMRFSPEMAGALEQGLKLESRRIITRGNSRLPRGDFDKVDLASGRPDGLFPVSSLRCRVETAGGRRSVTIAPRIRPNVMIWPRRGQSGAGARRENARFYLRVRQVQARRLNDISEAEAWLEGIGVFSGLDTAQPLQLIYGDAYEGLLERMGKTRAARWKRQDVHLELAGRPPGARDCFALLWELINGPGAWRANPWVWRYVFDRVAYEQVDVTSIANSGPEFHPGLEVP